MDNKEVSEMLVRWQDRIIDRAINEIEGLYFDFPVEDQTPAQAAYESGLRMAVRELLKMLNDKSRHGRGGAA